jgi:NAD(P)H-flavin reductase
VPAATVTTAPGRGAALFENEKQYARVLSKEALTGSVLGITLELERAVAWEPGHYARVHVDGVNWRDYSIVSLEGRLLTVWVDTRFAGPGSLWAQQSRVGSVVGVVVPVGSFCLVESERPIVMVATGTGLAPFVPMLQRLAARPSREVTLVFGCRARADDLTAYLPDNSGPDRSRTIVCVSREKPDEGARSRFASAGTVRYRAGRVTHLLASGELALVGADVYAAGNPDMVAEVRALVVPVRGTQLHTEAY